VLGQSVNTKRNNSFSVEYNATFVATWAEGRAMTLEQAIAYALDVEV